MQKQLFSTLLLLIWGSLLALPSYAQDDPASLYKQLNQNLAKGNYAQALKLIDQGADILHGGRYISSTYKVKAKKMPGFLVLLTLPVSLLNRSYTKTDHYDKLTIALHEVLKDTTRSPAKLQIVEYLLKKGAPPNGGRLLYGPEVRPVATAIKSWDLEAFWLLKKYGAKLDSKKVNALAALVYNCDCYSGANPQRDSIRFRQLEANVDTLIKKYNISPYRFYYSTIDHEKTASLFFKYVPPEKLDTKNYESPVRQACRACNLALIKKYKKMGFRWVSEKEKALWLLNHNSPECFEVIEYYVKNLGVDVNTPHPKTNFTLLSGALRFKGVPAIKKLLELGANFENPSTVNSVEELIYSRYNYKQLYKKETNRKDKQLWNKRYQEALANETFLLQWIEQQPRKRRRKLKKKLNIRQLLKKYPRS